LLCGRPEHAISDAGNITTAFGSGWINSEGNAWDWYCSFFCWPCEAKQSTRSIVSEATVSDAQLIALDDALAETYAEAGQFTESEAAYRHALSLVEKNEGQASLDQGRNEESIDLQQKSIRVLEAALGQEHPSLVVPFNNLATTYIKVGRFDESWPHLPTRNRYLQKDSG
jgi:tetratricopeptide (TPR) repeat protein